MESKSILVMQTSDSKDTSDAHAVGGTTVEGRPLEHGVGTAPRDAALDVGSMQAPTPAGETAPSGMQTMGISKQPVASADGSTSSRIPGLAAREHEQPGGGVTASKTLSVRFASAQCIRPSHGRCFSKRSTNIYRV